MNYRKLIPFVCGLALVASLSAYQSIKPGVERWKIKTSLQHPVSSKAGKPLDFARLVVLPDAPGVLKNDPKYNDAIIPASVTGSEPAEGTIVSTRGWLKLVALEADGDYHIQITGTAEPTDTACVIVEVPDPDPAFVATASLRPTFQTVRDFVRTKLLAGKDPSMTGNLLTHPVFVQVTGQLFYDDSHVNDPPRGKRGMKAKTLWEIHPITALKFAPKPKP